MQDVTPDVFFGSGNDNGFFTVDLQDGVDYRIELGLRGKLRFNPSNQPQNIFNSNGDGSYDFVAGAAQRRLRDLLQRHKPHQRAPAPRAAHHRRDHCDRQDLGLGMGRINLGPLLSSSGDK